MDAPLSAPMNAPTNIHVQPLTLTDLMAMTPAELRAIMHAGHPLDPQALVGRQYLGVDLSLPGWARRLLWHTFRKTFVRDAQTGAVRGWNVRMAQTGIDGPQTPMRDRKGRARSFGHYVVRSAEGMRFPQGWRGAQCLDYTIAGNARLDPAGRTRTPIVAVNPGDMDLLLGWEVFQVGPGMVSLPLYWAIRADGPLEEVVAPPRAG